MSVTVKIVVFWGVVLCSFIDKYQCCGGTCHHFQVEEECVEQGWPTLGPQVKHWPARNKSTNI
jgi:hypothetical protein